MNKLSLVLLLSLLLSACGDDAVIYQDAASAKGHKVMLSEIRVVSEQDDSLTLDVSYRYDDPVPAEQIKLFVLPDHGYWSSNSARVYRGENVARLQIGLSESNMVKDGVTESSTEKLRIRFEHYQPGKYVGNVWGQDVPYQKLWKLY